MSRIAPDVDRLMWLVAERSESAAVDDFEARFPELKYELAKRIAMLRGLRGARGTHPAGPAPAFRSPALARGPTFRFGWTTVALATGALAVASIAFLPRIPDANERGEARRDPAGATAQGQAIERFQESPQIRNPREAGEPAVPPESVEPTPDYALQRDLSIQGQSLVATIESLALRTGLTVEIAPGMPNFKVRIRYAGMTGLQMLQEMGPRFGFTAFDQGEGRVLIIPALDGGPAAADTVELGGPSPAAPLEAPSRGG